MAKGHFETALGRLMLLEAQRLMLDSERIFWRRPCVFGNPKANVGRMLFGTALGRLVALEARRG